MATDNLCEGGHAGPSFSRRTFAKAAGVSAAALAIGASGASLAWFTGRDVKENKLSIAQNLNIRVVEPAWDPENAKSVVPNQHIPKDPRIENLSDEFSGWMVVEIRVPTAVVSVFDETEQKVLDPARTPLFGFVADPRWTLLQQFEDGDEDVYRFGWPETIPALGQTPPIFEEVVVANLVEAQGQSGSKIITATGYGIQSEALPDIKTAWDAYKKQNGIGDGEPAKRIVSAVTAGTLLKFVEGIPGVGDTVDGKTIEEVVADIEHLEPQDATPLTSTPESITYVDGTTPTAPENTVNWFKNMSKVEEMDLFGLTVEESADTEGMFDGTSSLKKVHVKDNTIIVEKLPAGFTQTEEGGIYELIKIEKTGNLIMILTPSARDDRKSSLNGKTVQLSSSTFQKDTPGIWEYLNSCIESNAIYGVRGMTSGILCTAVEDKITSVKLNKSPNTFIGDEEVECISIDFGIVSDAVMSPIVGYVYKRISDGYIKPGCGTARDIETGNSKYYVQDLIFSTTSFRNTK